MSSSIKARWQLLLVWFALLGVCYWAGGRLALGAPIPPCSIACICAQVPGYNNYNGGTKQGTTWYYIAPPLGPQGLTASAVPNLLAVPSICSPGQVQIGKNQMYINDQGNWADACSVPPGFTGMNWATPPPTITWPGTNPPPSQILYCG
jgi:hypothetical protein